MNKFIQNSIQKFSDLDIPYDLVYRQNTVAKHGLTAADYIQKDVIVWDPLILYPHLVLKCPSCIDESQILKPHGWKDGKDSYNSPRTLQDVKKEVFLVSRVYRCNKFHSVIAHDAAITEQVRHVAEMPFLLFHKTGITRELFHLISSMIIQGMQQQTILCLWNQMVKESLYRKKKQFEKDRLLPLKLKDANEVFPLPQPSQDVTRSRLFLRVITACIRAFYFSKQDLFTRVMSKTTAKTMSLDHTFKAAANIGFWCRGHWTRVFDTLFIIMNENGKRIQ